jgi:sugar transferase (PEP-CTERM/EpsH1 system associated)
LQILEKDTAGLMKILFLAHRTPYPPNKGEKIRAYHVLIELVKRHSVSMAYWVDNSQDIQHVSVLRKLCQGSVVPVYLKPHIATIRGMKTVFHGRSFSEGYFYSPQFQSVVDRLIKSEQYDVVYAFSSVMAQFIMGMHDIGTIVDFVDVDSDKWGQLAQFKGLPVSMLYRREQEYLRRYETRLSQWARWNLFVSQAEADLFKSVGGAGSVGVLPNGVESDIRRLPLRDARCVGMRENRPNKPIRLIFVGTMNYYPNTDAVLYFVKDILPLIRKKYPQAIFEVVGRFPPRSVRKLDGLGHVRVVGEVGDVRSYLVQADVSVAPMRIARGVQNKVLEAMAVGIPVVTTSHGVKGIQVVKGDEVLIGDNPEEFASQVVRVLSDSRLYGRLVSKARNRVLESYSWKTIGVQLNDFVLDCRNSVSAGMAQSRFR